MLALCSAPALPGFSGCVVHIYQPLSGLHRPVVVDPGVRNFEDLSLTVRCLGGEHLSRQDNLTLCRRVSSLFESQGATVVTADSVGVPFDRLREPTSDDSDEPVTDLVLELRSRRLEQRRPLLSWVACAMTFTIVPAIDEEIFAQDITIRDGDGFLLVQDSLKGRIIRRYGVGPWAGNKLLDWLVRDDDEKLGGDAAEEDLSEDLYGQLTQMVYNAKMRWTVLQEAGSNWTPPQRSKGPS
ncbi:MAG: hypothetical protein ACI9MC_002091 [Kiritimatiellia bacterium]